MTTMARARAASVLIVEDEAIVAHDYRGSSSASHVAEGETPSVAAVTVTATSRHGRWYLTALTVPEGHPLVAPPTLIASR